MLKYDNALSLSQFKLIECLRTKMHVNSPKASNRQPVLSMYRYILLPRVERDESRVVKMMKHGGYGKKVEAYRWG